MSVKGSFVENDHMIEALATNRPDHAFHVGSLPWRSGCRQHFLDSQICNLLSQLGPEYSVPVTEQIFGHLVEWKCLPQLLRRSLGRRMSGDVEMNDPPSVVSQHKKHVQHLKANRRHGEKVDRHHTLDVILKEGPPGLRRCCRLRAMYLPTLVSPMSMPSLSNSPWKRGAPQSGFSRLILRISCRISLDTGGRPGWPRRTFQVQNNRKPLRCQPMTVSGLTMSNEDCQSRQASHNQAHSSRSADVRHLSFCVKS